MMDVDKMEAGRVMDALIAEKVMGLRQGVDFGKWDEHLWAIDADGEIDTDAYKHGDYHSGPMCERCGYGYCCYCQDAPDKPCEIHPPHYSTDIAAAWEVVEKATDYEMARETNGYIEKKGKNFSVYANIWINGEMGMAYAEKMPLAICRAALKAVGA